ncbi:MAG: XdhC family protein [Bacteroidota bacterium]
MLATIITASGSTPAPLQSRMLIRLEGKIRAIGTIGGGCMEGGILSSEAKDSVRERAQIMTFELNDLLGDTGLSCGGTLDVLLEPLNESMVPIYDCIAKAMESGEDTILVTGILRDGTTHKILLGVDGNVIEGGPLAGNTGAILHDAIHKVELTHKAERLRAGSEEYVIEFVQSEPPLIVFGGGHVGKVVSRCAALGGFRVTVVDDRPTFANSERFPEADIVCGESFEEAFEKLHITPSTYVVIVTRGHRHDEIVLERTLQFDPKYVGMIGSKRKVILAFKHLMADGASRARLSRVHAPVGLSIGAKTAEEIGISIVAELIAVRHNSRHLASDENSVISLMKEPSERVNN